MGKFSTAYVIKKPFFHRNRNFTSIFGIMTIQNIRNSISHYNSESLNNKT